MNFEWAFASRPLEGQLRCGDACTVKPFPGGALVAAIDGLGHGDAAADASELCVRVLEEQPDAPVEQQVLKCHERLKGTRGVVMSLVRFDYPRSALTWAGVGNVEAVLVRNDPAAKKKRETLMVFGGVVGGQLAGVRTTSLPLARDDLLMLATDGLKADFTHELDSWGECKAIAQKALLRWGKGTDDALVLVARWLGQGEAGAR
jgi:phosphoserine phosphatase RsbX